MGETFEKKGYPAGEMYNSISPFLHAIARPENADRPAFSSFSITVMIGTALNWAKTTGRTSV